jgi:hypothetical protein
MTVEQTNKGISRQKVVIQEQKMKAQEKPEKLLGSHKHRSVRGAGRSFMREAYLPIGIEREFLSRRGCSFKSSLSLSKFGITT